MSRKSISFVTEMYIDVSNNFLVRLNPKYASTVKQAAFLERMNGTDAADSIF